MDHGILSLSLSLSLSLPFSFDRWKKFSQTDLVRAIAIRIVYFLIKPTGEIQTRAFARAFNGKGIGASEDSGS